ncbi:tRNA (adenosine(37)-N6)-dimethylallyltransferase MiaA [Flavitalea flava]
MDKQNVIIILGPTAVGKTAAAIRLARELHTEIISADSRQCFTELTIGVAKPSPEDLAAVHHYFINSHSVQEKVNAALFEELSLKWTASIFQKQPAAVMVGGTGLYINAFCEGLDEMPVIDPGIRAGILDLYERDGIKALQEQMEQHDPGFYRTGEILNPRRLMRALEVKLSTGRSILSFRTREKKERPFHIKKIGLTLPKEQLHQRIHDRVDQMMEQGLLEEVKNLIPYRDYNALRTVGYSELFDYLDGRFSLDLAVETIKKNTRHYAKRQMTWFRKDPSIIWLDANDPDLLLKELTLS